VTPEALSLFLIIFAWTPPHFWSLALYRKPDYAKAGVPMLPVTRGDRETARQILWYTVVLVAVTLAPVGFGTFGVLYGIAAAVLGAAFLWLAIELRRTMARAAAVRLFHFSLLYLALLFVAMAIDTVVI
jgi:protoheme IX farnesyltransferase